MLFVASLIGLIAIVAYHTGVVSYYSPTTSLVVSHLSVGLVRDYALLHIRNVVKKHLETGLLTINPNHYDLVYYNDDRRYRVVFPKHRTPKIVVSVLHGEENVTDYVFECMGPSHDFHSIPTTPTMLGYNSLTFNMRDGRSLSFTGEEVIQLFNQQC